MVHRRPGRISQSPALLAAALLTVLLTAGCGGIAPPPPPPTEAAATMTPTPADAVGAEQPVTRGRATPPVEPVPCADGRLVLGDLLLIEAAWEEGVVAATEEARRWQADARLVQLQIGCQPLESGFRWQGTFYSDSAQSFYFSDTGQTEPAEDDPASIPTLPLDGISFQQLHVALARAGHDDSDSFNPATGVTVRLNVPSDPFGPPGIPEDVVYYVGVQMPGGVRDLFVSEANWTIYSYRDAG